MIKKKKKKRFYLKLLQYERDYCNREESLNSASNTAKITGDLYPMNRMRESVNEKLLRGI